MSLNLAQFTGISRWAIVHAWGEGNMVGQGFVSTNEPMQTSSSDAISTINPSITVGNWSYMDGFMDRQLNGRIYQQSQQANYALGGGGTGTLACLYPDQVIPAGNPLQFMYNSYGMKLNTGFAYTGRNVSPALGYAQALASTLPSDTGVIIAPTANLLSASLGVADWLPGAATIAVGGQSCQLYVNVLHVLQQALKVPGSYLHSHVCLLGEFDAAAGTIGVDQFSYNMATFFNSLHAALGMRGAPIIVGNLSRPYAALNWTGGVNNNVSKSLSTIANRTQLAVFVDSFVTPTNSNSAALNGDANALDWDTGSSTGPYYGSQALRTYGLNLFNYGFAKLTLPQVQVVTPPVTGVSAVSTTGTSITVTWNPSTNGSAYNFLLTVTTVGSGQTVNTGGNNTAVINTLVNGQAYTITVYAVSDWGVSTGVKVSAIAGNDPSQIDFSKSTMVVTSSPQQANGANTITITATFKTTSGAPVIGIASGPIGILSGINSGIVFTPGAGVVGTSQVTNSSGLVSWTVTDSNIAILTSNFIMGLTNFPAFPTGAMQFLGVSPTLSSLSITSPTTPADGTSVTNITANFKDKNGTAFTGYTSSALVYSAGAVAQVYTTPSSGRGTNGTPQAVDGGGSAVWALKSGDVFVGNVFVASMFGIQQTVTVTFNSVVPAANVDWIVLGDVTNSQPVTKLPFWFTAAGTSSVTNNSGGGMTLFTYTPQTINGVTKSWMDTRAIYATGTSNLACWEVDNTHVSTDFSFSLWMNATATAQSSFGVLLGSTNFTVNTPSSHNWYISFNSSQQFTGHTVNVYGQSITSPWPATLGISAGIWQHVVMTYTNSSNTINLYVNGNATPALTTTNTGNAGLWNPTTGFTSFGGQSTSNKCCSGFFADVVQYNAVLSPTQVTAVYNSYFLNP